MRSGTCAAWVMGVLVVLFAAPEGSAGELASWQPQMSWRIERGEAAPWATAQPADRPDRDSHALVGSIVRLEGDRVLAPDPLACSGARYELVVTPAEGLFQGMLAAPADRAARAARSLGISELPVLTLRVTCSTGLFDYHLVAADKAVLGLDNVIWFLSETRRDSSPEAMVLALLRDHMTHDMAFTRDSVARKQAHLTGDLTQAIRAYFARPVPHDEVPVINGDPFTNSQEYPSGFVLGRASIDGERAEVPVRFHDGARAKPVTLVLKNVAATWRLDDLRYDDGATFRGLLRDTPDAVPHD